jgi:uncharacterized membrane protein YuzA (DUF378 family)
MLSALGSRLEITYITGLDSFPDLKYQKQSLTRIAFVLVMVCGCTLIQVLFKVFVLKG